jgi:hypothetical protein
MGRERECIENFGGEARRKETTRKIYFGRRTNASKRYGIGASGEGSWGHGNEISWAAERWTGPQEGLCSMEFAN